MMLHLSLLDRYYRQIEGGEKENEYRDCTSYYKDRLVAEGPSVSAPPDKQGWVKCSDGLWRKFRPYSSVRFHKRSGQSMDIALRSIDCDGERYILRLGQKLGETAGGKEGRP